MVEEEVLCGSAIERVEGERVTVELRETVR